MKLPFLIPPASLRSGFSPSRGTVRLTLWLLFFATLPGGKGALLAGPPSLPSSAPYGDLFYAEGRYDLARLEYEKRRRELEKRGDSPPRLRQKLALSLMHLGMYRESLSPLRNDDTFPTLYLRAFASLRAGLPHLALVDVDTIVQSPRFEPRQRELGELLLGSFPLEKGNYEAAAAFYRDLAGRATHPETAKISDEIAIAIGEYRKVPRKRPWLAVLFSALLPGSGQIYAGHTADGITAFFFNASFLGAAAALYTMESRHHEGHGASVAAGAVGLFYYATNLTGAAASARRYNIHQERLFQQRVRDTFLNLGFVEQRAQVGFQSKF